MESASSRSSCSAIWFASSAGVTIVTRILHACWNSVTALAQDRILRNADPKEVPIDGGTRVEVKLKTNPFEPDGLLYRKNPFSKGQVAKLSRVIAAIAPACDVAITVTQNDEPLGNTSAGDWLAINSATLLNRITGGDDTDDNDEPSSPVKPWEDLVELRDEDGKLYGRARIDAANQWSTSGLLTVDGLAASKIGLIAGILVGVETTASRNSASPIVPAPVLASWSSEQAIALAAAEIPDAEKARAAAIVMGCGGDAGELPVVWWQEKWMTASQFVEAVEPLDRLEVYEGSISHEDDDDVTKREFESSFKASAKIAQTADGRYGRLRDTDWISTVTKGGGSTPLDVIEALLCEAWGKVETEEDTLVVGESNGTEIFRNLGIYTPMSDDEDEEAE